MNSIRCCISCILPCGALDVVRIVHSNGHVEEISGSIMAGEIMKAHPKHVLKIPSSPSHDGMVPNIVVVPPDAMLQRGKIYFLLPLPSSPHKSSSTNMNNRSQDNDSNSHRGHQHRQSRSMSNADNNDSNTVRW
ncbi:Sequence-specific DNA binding transcription factors isoform 1 [Hibiscus syriacus]|uniref:Sequence-specific DNA binding transcription factors isoform 1 n=1 Tax=Hibiscus syriacus TaxID=106335 RepID=A0A6A2WWK0_HIBSY|nr:Sequence-specific DNA binding transcription factors isoform 1 [Hibiscus syriacus]